MEKNELADIYINWLRGKQDERCKQLRKRHLSSSSVTRRHSYKIYKPTW